MTTQVPTELPSDEVAGDAPIILASDVPTEAKSDALSEPRTLVRVRWAGNRSKIYDGKVENVDASELTYNKLAVGNSVKMVWGRCKREWNGVIEEVMPASSEVKPAKWRRVAPTIYGSTYNSSPVQPAPSSTNLAPTGTSGTYVRT